MTGVQTVLFRSGLGGVNGAPAHLLAGLSDANAMIRIPEEVTDVRPGDIVEVIFLSQTGN